MRLLVDFFRSITRNVVLVEQIFRFNVVSIVHLDNLPVPVLRRHDDENAFCFCQVDNKLFRNILLSSGGFAKNFRKCGAAEIMEPLRQRAIADYVSRLRAGLMALLEEAKELRAAYEAELSAMDAEIARYERLIEDAQKQAEEESRFTATVAKQHGPSLSQSAGGGKLIRSSLGSDATKHHRSRGPKRLKATAGSAKSDALRAAAEQVLHEEGRPLKRAELTRRLQMLGFLAESDNPVDLVRKALQHHEVLRFDVKRGYFLAPWEDGKS